jgi:pimeloyl-ACP methyl ester carboxylesterase
VSLDLPGFGKSELPKAVWTVEDYADFLKTFLEKLEIKNLIFIGHSFGGSVIIKYLAEGGEAKKIILISPSGIRKKGIKIYIWYILAKIFKIIMMLPGLSLFKDKLRKKIYKAIDSEDYIEAGRLTESYKKIIREDLREDMAKINTKTVLVWGEKDKDTPLEYGEEMHALIRNSRLFIVKNAEHFSFIDKPEEFQKIFLAEINDN